MVRPDTDWHIRHAQKSLYWQDHMTNLWLATKTKKPLPKPTVHWEDMATDGLLIKPDWLAELMIRNAFAVFKAPAEVTNKAGPCCKLIN